MGLGYVQAIEALRQFPFQGMADRSSQIFSYAEKIELQMPSLHACASWQESTGLIDAPICPGIRMWR